MHISKNIVYLRYALIFSDSSNATLLLVITQRITVANAVEELPLRKLF